MSVNSHPHKLSSKKGHEKIIYLAVIAGPVMTLPQIYDIWIKDEKQVSAITWVSYLLVALIWLWWGVKHKEYPIVLTQLIWIALDALIVIGLMR